MSALARGPDPAVIGAKVVLARKHLAAEHPRKAVKQLEEALNLISEVDVLDDVISAQRDEVASLLMRALGQCGQSDSRVQAALRCYDLGARNKTAVLVVAAHHALDEKRTDPEAIGSYLDAVEMGCVEDASLRERMLQILAYALHVDPETPTADVLRILPSMERLRRLRPQMTFPRLYLGRWCYRNRQWSRVVSELLGISGKLAESPKVLNLLARSLEKLGRLMEAAKVYRDSLAADRQQAGIHFRLGRVLLALYREQAQVD